MTLQCKRRRTRSHARRLRSINNLRMCKLSVAALRDFEFDSLISLSERMRRRGRKGKRKRGSRCVADYSFFVGLANFYFFSFFFLLRARSIYKLYTYDTLFCKSQSRSHRGGAITFFDNDNIRSTRKCEREKEREIERKSTLLFGALVASNDKTNFTKCDSRIQSARLREDSDMLLQIFEIYNVQT